MQGSDAADPIRLAGELDRSGRHAEALSLLHQAAQAGDPRAMTQLGARLVTGRAAPRRPEEGATWLVRAGASGGPGAQRLASALSMAGLGAAPDPDHALDGLMAAAEGGDASARGQLAALTPDEALASRLAGPAPMSEAALRRARRSIDAERWLTPLSPETVSQAPRVSVFRGFLPAPACDWVRQTAKDRLVATAVNGPSAQAGQMRTATGAGYALLDTDVVLAMIRAKIAAATGAPVRCLEPTNVLHYEPGQEYRPHYDFFNPDVPQLAEQVRLQGQRSATVLIYLNDDYEGGATAFPRLDYAFKGRKGDALMFFNVDEAGAVDPRTLHAGTPPTAGRKWLLSQWIRDRDQPIV
jgi:prolyl 4-hydroxylase